MDTLTIKIKDSRALKLIQDLEDLKLIQVVKSVKPNETKLSSLLHGSISTDQAQEMHDQLKKMREEWSRDTY